MRQLINPRLANDSTDPGDAVVVLRGPLSNAVRLGVDLHAAELMHAEDTSVLANPFLRVKDRSLTTGLNNDCKRRDQHDRRRQHRQGQAGNHIEKPLTAGLQDCLCKPVREDHIAGVKGIQADLAQLTFEEACFIQHLDTAHLTFQNIADRQFIPTVIQSHNDFIDLMTLGELPKAGTYGPDVVRIDDPRADTKIDKTDYRDAVLIGTAAQS